MTGFYGMNYRFFNVVAAQLWAAYAVRRHRWRLADRVFAVAVLVLFAAAAGTGVVATDLGSDLDGFLADGFGGFVVVVAAFLGRAGLGAGYAGRGHLVFSDLELAHVGLLFAAFAD